MNRIKVVITTYQVPFDQTVNAVRHFTDEASAVSFINEESAKWWKDSRGDDCVATHGPSEDFPYKPIKELGYDVARYELWGGENCFHAMIDRASYARLHEAHYKREFDDQGLERPGYLQVIEASGNDPKNW